MYQIYVGETIPAKLTVLIKIVTVATLAPAIGLGGAFANLIDAAGTFAPCTNPLVEIDPVLSPGVYSVLLTTAEAGQQGPAAVSYETAVTFANQGIVEVQFVEPPPIRSNVAPVAPLTFVFTNVGTNLPDPAAVPDQPTVSIDGAPFVNTGQVPVPLGFGAFSLVLTGPDLAGSVMVFRFTAAGMNDVFLSVVAAPQ